MTWARTWNKIDGTETVEISLDNDYGVKYIYDNTSVFPRYTATRYDKSLDVFSEMEYYHEHEEYEEV